MSMAAIEDTASRGMRAKHAQSSRRVGVGKEREEAARE